MYLGNKSYKDVVIKVEADILEVINLRRDAVIARYKVKHQDDHLPIALMSESSKPASFKD